MTKFTIEDLRDIAYRGSYDDLERELALQLLASMGQAPVYLRPFGDDGETFVACDGNDERAIPLYAAPQLPQPAVGNDFLPRNLDRALGVLGMAMPESREEFNFQQERWIQRLIDRVIRCADELVPQPEVEKAHSSVIAEQLAHVLSGMKVTSHERAVINCAVDRLNKNAAMLQGAEPVSQPYTLPDGYCVMPKKLTAENGAKGALSGEFHVTHRITCQSCGGEGCEDCNEEGGWDGEIPIGWDTIKLIYGAAVESCALPAAPQQED